MWKLAAPLMAMAVAGCAARTDHMGPPVKVAASEDGSVLWVYRAVTIHDRATGEPRTDYALFLCLKNETTAPKCKMARHWGTTYQLTWPYRRPPFKPVDPLPVPPPPPARNAPSQ